MITNITLKKMNFKLPKHSPLKLATKLRTMKQLQRKTDMKFSVTQTKVIQTDVTMIMINYRIMSRQTYHYGK